MVSMKNLGALAAMALAASACGAPAGQEPDVLGSAPSAPMASAAPAESTGAQVGPACQAGQALRDCPDCPELVAIPAGSFEMWASRDLRVDGAPPPIPVTLQPFALGRFEVTWDEYLACAADGGCQGNRDPDDREFGRGRQPVIGVSYTDATAYVDWLSQKTGRRYRLPNDAEWEYAARGGRPGLLPELPASPGQYQPEGSPRVGPRNGARPVEVGSHAADGLGLHDMHGNVWEWVNDCYDQTPHPGPKGEASETGECGYRVQRGGGWNRSIDMVWTRGGNRLLYRDYDAGFRVLRELDPEDCTAPAP